MSSESNPSRVKILNRLSALLMVMMLVCQFLPYWQFGEGETASLHGYVWFPTNHTQLGEELLPLVEKFPSNQAAIACIPVLALCMLGIFFCLTKADKQQMGVWSVLTGTSGLVLYLTSPVMRAGFLCWVHTAVFVLMLITGIMTLTVKKRA